MNKKGEADIGAIILVILLIVVVVGSFILMLIIVNEKTKKIEYLDNSISVYINNIDNQTKTQISGKYFLINNGLVNEGYLSKDSLTEIKGITSKQIEVYCKEDGYYLSSTEKVFSDIEISNNISKITCNSNSYGNLEIESNSSINDKKGYIKLDISSKRHFNNISGVISWKSGTIFVKYKDKSTEIPNRFKETADYAFETNISLSNSNSTIILEYEAIELRNSEDCITVTLFDKDSYILDGNLYQSSENGENLGNPKDFSKTFCYNEI